MTQQQSHPTDSLLTDFVLGKLPNPEDGEVESHLAECPECETRAAVAHPDDTLVSLLAAAGTRVDADRSAAPTPTLDGSATPPAFAPTLALDDSKGPMVDPNVPAAL
ncbi:MAG TPA: zf-HC2 domain-containing protein, partial [Chloroflexota bacterium]|nr:zf-HC2 domain-containing protein [Chloroflexota bacterium]